MSKMRFMYVEVKTTPEELIEELSDKLTDSEKKELVRRIESYGEKQILRNMLKGVPDVTLSNWHLTEHDRDLVEKIANHLPVKARAGLMKLNYDDLVMLQKFHLDDYYQLLRKVVANKFKERSYGEDVSLETFLQYIEYEGIKYSEKNFINYVAKRSFPVKYLRIMKKVIENELVEKDEEEVEV